MLEDAPEGEQKKWYRVRDPQCGGTACWYVARNAPVPGAQVEYKGFRLCDGSQPADRAPAICENCHVPLKGFSSGMFEEVDPLTVEIPAPAWAKVGDAIQVKIIEPKEAS